MKRKAFLFCVAISILEIAIYFWSCWVAPSENLIYQLAARYSARVSFFIFSITLLLVGALGLNKIFSNEKWRSYFILFLLTFALNHLIHFFYLAMNHWVQDISLISLKNGGGTIGYILLTLAPFYLWKITSLSQKQYWAIQLYILTISTFFIIAYLKRLREEIIFPSTDNLIFSHLALLTILIGFNAYRVYCELIEQASKKS